MGKLFANKWLLIGLIGAAGIGGYYLLAGGGSVAAGEPDTSADGYSSGNPLLYATGLGTQAQSSDATAAGTSSIGSAMEALSAAMNMTSANDLTASLAGIGAEKEVALASIKTDFMTDFLAAIPTLAKSGVSQITGNGFDTGIVYTNPAQNLSYASGYDSYGNLIGTKPGGGTMILMQSAQKNYDMTKYVDALGKVGTGVVTTLGSMPQTIKDKVTPTKTQYIKKPGMGGGINNTGITSPTGMQTRH